MQRTIVITLLASACGIAAAQATARPDPADPKAAALARPHESAFKGYRPYVEPEVARWREANEEMGRLNGHIGHVPGSVPPRGAAAAPKPPAHAGNGERK
jgi:hypothetical protein